jgi:NitT/TauT family transport system substrate-binding protein
MLKQLYVNGLGDALIADPGSAAELVLAGHGHATLRLAEVGGVMPNSVYYVLRDRLDELTPKLVPFTTAIQEAMNELKGSAGADHVELFKNEWPDADPDVLVAATDELLSNGTWSGVRIARSGCDNWTSILHEAGLTVAPVAYEQIVTTTIVDEVGA